MRWWSPVHCQTWLRHDDSLFRVFRSVLTDETHYHVVPCYSNINTFLSLENCFNKSQAACLVWNGFLEKPAAVKLHYWKAIGWGKVDYVGQTLLLVTLFINTAHHSRRKTFLKQQRHNVQKQKFPWTSVGDHYWKKKLPRQHETEETTQHAKVRGCLTGKPLRGNTHHSSVLVGPYLCTSTMNAPFWTGFFHLWT